MDEGQKLNPNSHSYDNWWAANRLLNTFPLSTEPKGVSRAYCSWHQLENIWVTAATTTKWKRVAILVMDQKVTANLTFSIIEMSLGAWNPMTSS